jgi:hypothetical protein
MTTREWHVAPETWQAYVDGRLDVVGENAVDTHVLRCVTCRSSSAAHVSTPELERVWSHVAAEVARPEPSLAVRLLRRVGLQEQDALLLGGSTGLYLPWAMAVGAAVACAIVTGFVPSQQDLAFLLGAPLIPVLAVAAAHDATDPMRELVAGTPYNKLRLALLRAVAALAVAVPVTVAVGLLVPGLGSLAFAWLLPGLCLTSAVLVLLTRFTAWVSGGLVAVVWVLVVAQVSGQGSLGRLDSAPAQLVFAAAAAAMAGCLVARTATSRLRGGY